MSSVNASYPSVLVLEIMLFDLYSGVCLCNASFCLKLFLDNCRMVIVSVDVLN